MEIRTQAEYGGVLGVGVGVGAAPECPAVLAAPCHPWWSPTGIHWTWRSQSSSSDREGDLSRRASLPAVYVLRPLRLLFCVFVVFNSVNDKHQIRTRNPFAIAVSSPPSCGVPPPSRAGPSRGAHTCVVPVSPCLRVRPFLVSLVSEA